MPIHSHPQTWSILTWMAVAVPLSLAAFRAEAAERVALVIGNSAYRSVAPLPNPIRDAQAVKAVLEEAKFEVVHASDATAEGIRTSLDSFARKAAEADEAVVYFAGHAVQMNGANHLLPVDIAVSEEADVARQSLSLDEILKRLDATRAKAKIVILDACRDNPFAKELARSMKTRSAAVGAGLSEIAVNSAAGTMIAFATDPGKTALDGTAGQNSPFTTALLKHMESPGVSISTVMDRVREDVWRSTNEKQRPWVNTSIIGEFYLNPAPAGAAAKVAALGTTDGMANMPATAVAPTLNPQAFEMKLWEAAERSNNVEDYKAYLEAHPNGYFAQIAKNRIARGTSTTSRSAIDETALKSEAGTAKTEAELKHAPKDRIEVQQRLKALGFDPGGATGKFGPGTRAALANWQKTREIPETGYLTKNQYAALSEQSESDYQKLLAAKPSVVRSAAPPRPRRQPQEAYAGQPRQAAPPPQPQRGGASLGEVGTFLGGVGSLVGGIRGR